jgi:hypothetical protein
MKISIFVGAIFLFLFGCASPLHIKNYPSAFSDGVDIAVNLGLAHTQDIDKLEDALASEGMPCRRRAMSLNAEQIVVERRDFEQAKILAISIMIRDKLTVRVYKSPDSAKSSATSLLEVWEKGQNVREESYKIYN